MSLIQIKDAEFYYGQTNILRDISFTLERGEIFCVLGPNGCGKTTLLDCILGVLKLHKGSILTEGRDITHLKASRLAKQISYVPQRHDRTFPYKVIEMTIMGRTAYTAMFSNPTIEDQDIAEEALRVVGISHLKDRPYTQLSGGEAQLVLIARALAQKSPVIIMDEPTSHLDFRNELLILEIIIKLVKEKMISIIMATHFPNHAFYFDNNNVKITVAMLERGKFMAIGSPEIILTEENIQKVYGVKTVISEGDNMEAGYKQVIPIRTVG